MKVLCHIQNDKVKTHLELQKNDAMLPHIAALPQVQGQLTRKQYLKYEEVASTEAKVSKTSQKPEFLRLFSFF